MANKTRRKETRTYADRRKYLAEATSRRRKHLKDLIVIEGGGKCQICGYKKYRGALDFHHINEKKKKFSLSVRDLTKSWPEILNEIHKCVLVCSNCHREIHGGLVKLPKVSRV
jgi:5-methylcytosine-specific restriction endonuclease McrA